MQKEPAIDLEKKTDFISYVNSQFPELGQKAVLSIYVGDVSFVPEFRDKTCFLYGNLDNLEEVTLVEVIRTGEPTTFSDCRKESLKGYKVSYEKLIKEMANLAVKEHPNFSDFSFITLEKGEKNQLDARAFYELDGKQFAVLYNEKKVVHNDPVCL